MIIYEVPIYDCSFVDGEGRNHFPNSITLKEKYKKPINLIKPYYVIKQNNNKLEYNEITYGIFKVNKLIETTYEKNVFYMEEKHFIDNRWVQYTRIVHDNIHSIYTSEHPEGKLVFNNTKELSKFKLLLE